MTVTLRAPRQASTLAAWGLGCDGNGWWREAACVGTPDLHTADLRSGWQDRNSDQAKARHICLTHCPVLAECAADARRSPPFHLVQAGAVWVTSGQPSHGTRVASVQPPDPGCGPWCDHLQESGP